MIIHNEPSLAYHANPALGSNTAKQALDSLQLLKDDLDGLITRKGSAALNFGTAFHLKVLQPHLFATQISPEPLNPKTGRPYGQETKAFQEWADANPGMVAMSTAELETMNRMMSRCPSDILAIFNPAIGEAEMSVYRQIAGVETKCRPDWVQAATITDLKTIGNIADIEKHINKFKYWFSHAWYRMIMKEETGRAYTFRFVFAEKNPPHRWRLVELDAEWVQYADHLCDLTLGAIAMAQSTDNWADPVPEPLMVSRPAWESDDDDEEGGEA